MVMSIILRVVVPNSAWIFKRCFSIQGIDMIVFSRALRTILIMKYHPNLVACLIYMVS